MAEASKTEQIDSLTSVTHLGRGEGDVLCDYNKYLINETGDIFYEETDVIRDAYHKHCETVVRMNIHGVAVEMIGCVTRRPTYTWVANQGIGAGYTAPIPAITLYNYLVLSSLEYFVSDTRNIHVAYSDFIKREKPSPSVKCCIC